MKTCPSGFRPCTRCHSGKTNGHALDHSRVREFRPPGSAKEETVSQSDVFDYLFDKAREDVSAWVEANHPTRPDIADLHAILDGILVQLLKDIKEI